MSGTCMCVCVCLCGTAGVKDRDMYSNEYIYMLYVYCTCTCTCHKPHPTIHTSKCTHMYTHTHTHTHSPMTKEPWELLHQLLGQPCLPRACWSTEDQEGVRLLQAGQGASRRGGGGEEVWRCEGKGCRGSGVEVGTQQWLLQCTCSSTPQAF